MKNTGYLTITLLWYI